MRNIPSSLSLTIHQKEVIFIAGNYFLFNTVLANSLHPTLICFGINLGLKIVTNLLGNNGYLSSNNKENIDAIISSALFGASNYSCGLMAKALFPQYQFLASAVTMGLIPTMGIVLTDYFAKIITDNKITEQSLGLKCLNIFLSKCAKGYVTQHNVEKIYGYFAECFLSSALKEIIKAFNSPKTFLEKIYFQDNLSTNFFHFLQEINCRAVTKLIASEIASKIEETISGHFRHFLMYDLAYSIGTQIGYRTLITNNVPRERSSN